MSELRSKFNRVLLVVKKTNFELHGENLRQQLERGRFNNEAAYRRLEFSHAEHMKCLARLEAYLSSKVRCDYFILRRESIDVDLKSFDLIMTVGGDGTLLSVSKRLLDLKHPPIMGIRSSSDSVGYLCGAEFGNFESRLNHVFFDTMDNAQQVTRLEVVIDPSLGEPWVSAPVLNDVLYCNAHPAATSRYVLRVCGEGERHKSSGIWISTAMGSTAALMAAGGLRQDSFDSRLQYRVREPYTHDDRKQKLVGGYFDGESDMFEVSNLSESAIVAMDGIHGEYRLGYGDKFTIRKSLPLNIFLRREKVGE